MRKLKEYALYNGDEFVMIGTMKEIAEHMGVTEDSARQFVSPSAERKGKKKIIRIEEEENEEI